MATCTEIIYQIWDEKSSFLAASFSVNRPNACPLKKPGLKKGETIKFYDVSNMGYTIIYFFEKIEAVRKTDTKPDRKWHVGS